ncbi:MAG: hypothetical protein RSC57_03170 [Bacilli bacterium]
MRIDITSLQQNKPIKIKQSIGEKSVYVVLSYSLVEKAVLINIVANSCIDSISNKSKTIEVAYQKTGFGFKRFFKCPYCGARRKYLYPVDIGAFACSNCVERNVYAYRTNIYDESIENVIRYKILRLLMDLQIDIEEITTSKINMLNLLSNIPNKPKYMRENKYETICKQIYFLEFIYGEVLNRRMDKFKAKELNEMLDKDNVNFVYENFIVPRYFPNVEKELKALN